MKQYLEQYNKAQISSYSAVTMLFQSNASTGRFFYRHVQTSHNLLPKFSWAVCRFKKLEKFLIFATQLYTGSSQHSQNKP